MDADLFTSEPFSRMREIGLWSMCVVQAVRLADHGDAVERAWFYDEKIEPGSFLWICQMLGLDSGAIRKSLSQRWSDSHQARKKIKTIRKRAKPRKSIVGPLRPPKTFFQFLAKMKLK